MGNPLRIDMLERLKTHRLIVMLLPVTIIALVLLLQALGILQKLEWQSYDWRMAQTRASAVADERIAIIMIDDASLKALDPIIGRWPWPRAVYAELLDFLALGQPRAVLFDITFTERQGHTSSDRASDSALAEASRDYPFVYHAARLVRDDESSTQTPTPLPDEFAARFSVNQRLLKSSQVLPGFKAASNTAYYLPFAELWQNSPGIGIVDVNADSDGIYRRARLLHRYQDWHFPALSITALLDHRQTKHISLQEEGMSIDGQIIPLDSDEQYRVNFYRHFNTYSFSGVLAALQQIRQGELDDLLISPYEFEDKLVFIGASAAGLQDLKTTPVDGRLPGVLLHASIASNLLQQDFLRPMAKPVHYGLLTMLVLITILTIFTFPHVAAQTLVPIILAALTGYGALKLFEHNIVLELTPLLLAIGLSWFGSVSGLLLTEGREKRRFKRMMSQYLSPAVLNTVVAHHRDFAQAEVGTQEEVSILFSDIRGFTNLSEQLSPQQIVEILNYYFSRMTEVIFERQGTIDKFIGDAIMAFWGAPLKTDHHAAQAVRAGLEMQQRLTEVNHWLQAGGHPPVSMGIGIHTGQVVLGNIGSEYKLDYTIIGDSVNLASRIEGLTKRYQSGLIITEATLAKLPPELPCRVLDLVRVKGKQRPIRIYQPLAWLPSQSHEQAERLLTIALRAEQAFEAYLQRDWPRAIECLRALPDDPARQLLIRRCQQYQRQPPGKDWDGVFVLNSK